MRILSSNGRLMILTLTVLLFCFGYFALNEASRTRKAEREFAQLDPATVVAVRFENGTITQREEIDAVVASLQRSHWRTFERKYSTERQRLLLLKQNALPYIVDLRPLADGSDLVQIVSFNPSNQAETLLLSGENSEVGRLLQGRF